MIAGGARGRGTGGREEVRSCRATVLPVPARRLPRAPLVPPAERGVGGWRPPTAISPRWTMPRTPLNRTPLTRTQLGKSLPLRAVVPGRRAASPSAADGDVTAACTFLDAVVDWARYEGGVRQGPQD